MTKVNKHLITKYFTKSITKSVTKFFTKKSTKFVTKTGTLRILWSIQVYQVFQVKKNPFRTRKYKLIAVQPISLLIFLKQKWQEMQIKSLKKIICR